MGKSLLRILNLIYKYSVHHKFYTMVGGYFIISLLMLIFFDINIAIPCLFKSILGFTCPGCGLTHAFIHLLKLEFKEAYFENNFIFIFAVAGLYFIVIDFLAFVKRENFTTTQK